MATSAATETATLTRSSEKSAAAARTSCTSIPLCVGWVVCECKRGAGVKLSLDALFYCLALVKSSLGMLLQLLGRRILVLPLAQLVIHGKK